MIGILQNIILLFNLKGLKSKYYTVFNKKNKFFKTLGLKINRYLLFLRSK